jgi:hypothetical protein
MAVSSYDPQGHNCDLDRARGPSGSASKQLSRPNHVRHYYEHHCSGGENRKSGRKIKVARDTKTAHRLSDRAAQFGRGRYLPDKRQPKRVHRSILKRDGRDYRIRVCSDPRDRVRKAVSHEEVTPSRGHRDGVRQIPNLNRRDPLIARHVHHDDEAWAAPRREISSCPRRIESNPVASGTPELTTGALAAVSKTSTRLSPRLDTYTCEPSGVTAMPAGKQP